MPKWVEKGVDELGRTYTKYRFKSHRHRNSTQVAEIRRYTEAAKSKSTSQHASKLELIRQAELDLKERRRDDAAAAASREAARATRSSVETPKGGKVS